MPRFVRFRKQERRQRPRLPLEECARQFRALFTPQYQCKVLCKHLILRYIVTPAYRNVVGAKYLLLTILLLIITLKLLNVFKK